MGGDESNKTEVSLPFAATTIGNEFSLVDIGGIPRTQDDYKETYKLVYFGFTYCPAICPTELSKMTEAYLSLPENMQHNIRPIFITVDPERDTPAVMKGYVSLFMPQLVGLTGSVAQIEAAKKSFKVYAAKVPEGDEYTMDHSSFIYFQTPDNKTAAIFRTSDTSEQMAQRISEILEQ